jgi:hypothetical protein
MFETKKYGMVLIAATVSDMFDTLDQSDGAPLPVPHYVSMNTDGIVGLQFGNADQVREIAASFGRTADTTLIGPDDNREVLTQANGTWTTTEAQLTLTFYNITKLDSMSGDDSGTDRLLGDVNPWRASRLKKQP